MKTATALAVGFALAAVLGCNGTGTLPGTPEESAAALGAGDRTWDFETAAVHSIPAGWKVEATRSQGPLATWEVVEDPTAPGGSKVLALTRPNHRVRRTYNLCWTETVSFGDGAISLRFRASSGSVDQGGGPIWRVQDRDNYYVCRANPLESNFRVYYVKDGRRTQLASAPVEVPTGKWQLIEIEQHGAHIVCKLNGNRLLEIDDTTFPEAGGVGLWTKADAATSFDDIRIRSGAR